VDSGAVEGCGHHHRPGGAVLPDDVGAPSAQYPPTAINAPVISKTRPNDAAVRHSASGMTVMRPPLATASDDNRYVVAHAARRGQLDRIAPGTAGAEGRTSQGAAARAVRRADGDPRSADAHPDRHRLGPRQFPDVDDHHSVDQRSDRACAGR